MSMAVDCSCIHAESIMQHPLLSRATRAAERAFERYARRRQLSHDLFTIALQPPARKPAGNHTEKCA